MKLTIRVIFFCWLNITSSQAQPLSSCTNADFEMGNFNNWVAKTGYCFPITMTNTGVVTGRHTIMSAGGTDPYSMGMIPFVPPGGGAHTVRLGNDNVGSEAEQLIYAFTVTASNALFIYRYAVVLEDPGHPPAEQPRFDINVFDQSNVPIPCGTYSVVASGVIPGFYNNGDYRIKPWTTVGIDLSGYIGQTVRIEFTTADCGYGGHFGYAYMECYCSPFQIFSDFCPGMNTALLQAPIGFAHYAWSTGDTTSSIVINNPVNGSSYSVTMTSVTGCQVTLTSVLSQSSLFANFYATTFCANHVSFMDSSYVVSGSPIQQWQWDFGDGSTSTTRFPLHAYADSGTYNVHLHIVNAGGCYDSITIPIQTIPFPRPAFSFSPECPGMPVQFTDSSFFSQGSISDWHWSFGDGDTSDLQNPAHAYGNSLSHAVTLLITASNGCYDSITTTVNSLPQPVALFIVPTGCVNTPLHFNDGSYMNGGSIAGTTWNFGDSTALSTDSDVIHTYASWGNYPVTLIAAAGNGCTDTVVRNVIIRPAPVAALTYDPVCLYDTIVFHDSSAIASGVINGHNWYYGDGDSLVGATLAHHNYTSPGPYDVMLVVKSSYGCRDTVTVPVQYLPMPVAAYGNSVACPYAPIQFTDNSSLAGGNIVSWEWNFDDMSGDSHLQDPVHTYQSGGSYNVQLIVSGSNGCVDTTVSSLAVQPAPLAAFYSLPVCERHDMEFTDASFFASGSITGWSWDFGDATAYASQQNPGHIYSTSGVYDVTLEVTASNGCTAESTFPVHVYPMPVPQFLPPVTCEHDTMTLQDFTTVSSGSIAAWNWRVDDSVFFSVQNPALIFTDLDLHQVLLLATTDLGCADSTELAVHLSPLPEPGMHLTDGCFPEHNVFIDASTVKWGFINGWEWNFGDSTVPANSSAAYHTYSDPGTYEVQLSVVTDAGCRASVTQMTNLWKKPSVDFMPDKIEGCEPLPVSFTTQSDPGDGNVQQWQWDFGNGTFDSISDAAALFENSGTFSVSVVVTTDHGCKDTASYQNLIIVYPTPDAGFTYDPAVTDIYNPIITFHDASNAAVSRNWAFGDYTGSDESDPVHAYMAPGIYTVQQVVFSDQGCPDTLRATVEIKPQYLYVVPNAFTPNGDGDNDSFIGQGIGVKNFTMCIFDRWGKKIYETRDQSAPWDGRYEDKPAQSDVYVYKIQLVDVFENYHEFVGKVTLVR